MRAKAVGFTAAKSGRTPVENEDAFHVPRSDGTRFAIADGATESSYSKAWARLLVEAVGDVTTLALAQHEWQSRRPQDLPWYAVENFEQGAFAALLFLEVGLKSEWFAASIGDCCLFQVRGGRLLKSWPFTDPKQFHNYPILLGSRSTLKSLTGHIKRFTGQQKPGDEFWLATDALAHWLLIQHLAGLWPSVGLADVSDDAGFRAYVESRRGQGLRNDDTTFVRVTLTDGA